MKTYHGYTFRSVKRQGCENYAVKPPVGPEWSEEAANLKTARKWVDADLARTRNKSKV